MSGFGPRFLLCAAIAFLGIFLISSSAQAAVVFTNPSAENTWNTNNDLQDCPRDEYAEEMNQKESAVKVQQALYTSVPAGERGVQMANYINDQASSYWFCTAKITSITDIIDTMSALASNIMGAIFTAIKAFLRNLIITAINTACNAFVSAANSIASMLCLPNFQLNLGLPDIAFPQFGGTLCPAGGTPLFHITGGPSLPSPPMSYSTTIPGTTWQGRVNVLR